MYQLPEGGSKELARQTAKLLTHPLLQLISLDQPASAAFIEYLHVNQLCVNSRTGWCPCWVLDDTRQGWLQYVICEHGICQARKQIYKAMELVCSGPEMLQEALQGCQG